MLTLLALVVEAVQVKFGPNGPDPRYYDDVDVWFWPSVTNRQTGEVVQWASATAGSCGLVSV